MSGRPFIGLCPIITVFVFFASNIFAGFPPFPFRERSRIPARPANDRYETETDMNHHAPLKPFDDAKAEAFAGRLAGAMNEASLALMTALGHRTGLFDCLAERPGITSAALAAGAGLSERYVREWLAVMVTSRVVDYDPRTSTYAMPAEHAAFLTRKAGPDNMAVLAQVVTEAASVEQEMVARFQTGEGLHYGHFDRFHEVMAELSGQTVVSAIVEQILPIVPGLIGRLETGIDVVDLGCGAGAALLRLAEAFPESRFTGLDLCADAFADAEAEAARKGLSNLSFEARDLSGVDSIGGYDLVTAFDAVHDQKDPKALLAMVRNSLRPDGEFLMQEIGGSRHLEKNMDYPFAPFIYTTSLMHCTPISIGQGGLGLGTMWGTETATEFLHDAGFGAVEIHRLPHDPVNAYFVARI